MTFDLLLGRHASLPPPSRLDLVERKCGVGVVLEQRELALRPAPAIAVALDEVAKLEHEARFGPDLGAGAFARHPDPAAEATAARRLDLLHERRLVDPFVGRMLRDISGPGSTSFGPDPLAWLGSCLSVYAERDPWWDRVREARSWSEAEDVEWYSIPLVVRIDVKDPLASAFADIVREAQGDPLAIADGFLDLKSVFGAELAAHHAFRESVRANVIALVRDGAMWERPDEFDIARRTTGHMGFGFGIHACAEG